MKTLASLSLKPGPDAVSQALGWLEALAEREDWPRDTAFRLGLCADEALTNIVMYGFPDTRRDASPPRIDLEVSGGDQRIVLLLADNGLAFDPTKSDPKDLAGSLSEADIGGHGLRIMQHYLQNIEYRRAQGRNHLYLTMALDASKAPP